MSAVTLAPWIRIVTQPITIGAMTVLVRTRKITVKHAEAMVNVPAAIVSMVCAALPLVIRVAWPVARSTPV